MGIGYTVYDIRDMGYSLEGKEEGTGASNQDARQVEDTRVWCGH